MSYIDYISSIYDIAVISDFVALLSTVGAANATAQCCCVNDYRSLVRRVFVRNVVVQIPKFDAKPNPNPNSNLNPNPMPIRFGQMILRK